MAQISMEERLNQLKLSCSDPEIIGVIKDKVSYKYACKFQKDASKIHFYTHEYMKKMYPLSLVTFLEQNIEFKS